MNNYVSPLTKVVQLELKKSVLDFVVSDTSGGEGGGSSSDFEFE